MKIPTHARSASTLAGIREHAKFTADLGSPDGILALAYLDRSSTNAGDAGEMYVITHVIAAIADYEKARSAEGRED